MNFRVARLAVAFAAWAAATAALASPRISVGEMQGDRGAILSGEISAALCDSFECVPPGQVTTRGKVDFAKMRAAEVAGFLSGSIAHGGGSDLHLALLRTSQQPSRTWTLAVKPGLRLDPAELGELKTDLGELIGSGLGPPPPAALPPEAHLAAGGRIVLGAVAGVDPSVTRQLSTALCAEHECVRRERAISRGKVDYPKMRASGVGGVLFGSVAGAAPNRSLWLAFTTGPDRTRSWKLPLGRKGKLSPESLAELAEGARAELAAAAPEAAPAAEPPPPAAPVESPGAAPSALAATAPPPPAPAPPPPAPSPPAAPPPLPPPAASTASPAAPARSEAAPPAPRPTVVSVEAGVFVTSRNLSFSGVQAGGVTPFTYSAAFIAGPWIGIEFFPLALAGNGVASGLGLIVNYETSVGLNSDLPIGGSASSLFWWLRAGAEWRVQPAPQSRFAIVPSVSYVHENFTLSPSYPGLPNSTLSGVEGSLRLEIPVGSALSILGSGSFVYWFTAEQLVGDSLYFSDGSAWGFDADAGLSLRIWGPLCLRGLAFYSLTSYTLTPTATYQATGASDRYLGGRLTLRADF